MKNKYKLALMDMAERFGQTSEAVRLRVGALLVKNDSIISLGVNGQPPKWPTEVCEEWVPNPNGITKDMVPVTLPTVRHAEVACLEKLWNSTETAKGAEMFISHSPCKNCSIKLLTAGISKVYYRHSYRDNSGIEYLLNNGVEVEQI
jgi:dCMP deaminase